MAQLDEKFFFHMHNFDDDIIDEPPLEEEEDLPPPPPVFSESELEAAQQKAFAQGHAKGVQETENSRAQALASLMQKLAQDMQTLFALEAQRENIFEKEVILLSKTLFEHVFPKLHEKHGFDEMIDKLQSVLTSQKGQKRIEIRVSNDFLPGVEAFIKKLQANNPDLQCSVIADSTLNNGSFKLGWEDGGAMYDATSITNAIISNLDEMLAGKDVPRHNDIDDESCASDEKDGNSQKPIAEDKHNDE